MRGGNVLGGVHGLEGAERLVAEVLDAGTGQRRTRTRAWTHWSSERDCVRMTRCMSVSMSSCTR